MVMHTNQGLVVKVLIWLVLREPQYHVVCVAESTISLHHVHCICISLCSWAICPRRKQREEEEGRGEEVKVNRPAQGSQPGLDWEGSRLRQNVRPAMKLPYQPNPVHRLEKVWISRIQWHIMFLSQQEEQESSAVHDIVEQPGTADKAEEEPDGTTAASDSPTSDSEWKKYWAQAWYAAIVSRWCH